MSASDVLASLDLPKCFNIALADKHTNCHNLGDSDAARFLGARSVFALSLVLTVLQMSTKLESPASFENASDVLASLVRTSKKA